MAFQADALPLQGPISAARHVHVDSCLLDEEHFQVRGSLVTTRADYVDPSQVHCYQHVVVRLSLRFTDMEIVAADFAMPHEPFANVCSRLPIGAAALVGLRVRKGFGDEVKRRFPSGSTCSDLQALLRAMASLIPAIGAMNGPFRRIDESLPGAEVPAVFDGMVARHKAAQTCHAWTSEAYGVPHHFAAGDYDVVLSRVGSRVHARWRKERA